MRYRTLGRTGVTVSEIGFGAWAIGGSWGEQKESDSVAALHRALDLGYRDGKWIRRDPDLRSLRKHPLFQTIRERLRTMEIPSADMRALRGDRAGLCRTVSFQADRNGVCLIDQPAYSSRR